MPDRIRDIETAEAALASPLFLLFKHSHRCSISTRAFTEYEAFVAGRPDLPTGWIDVVEDRPVSLQVAETTGVEHKSPQALLIRDGAVAWDASHFDITRKSLGEAL